MTFNLKIMIYIAISSLNFHASTAFNIGFKLVNMIIVKNKKFVLGCCVIKPFS